MWHLIRLAFRRWRGKQERTIDRLLQAEGGLNISPQIGDNYLLIYDPPVTTGLGSFSGQSDVHDSICDSKCRGNLIEDGRSMRRVMDRGCSNVCATRFGIVCHDGSYRFREWSEAKACLVPFTPSSPK